MRTASFFVWLLLEKMLSDGLCRKAQLLLKLGWILSLFLRPLVPPLKDLLNARELEALLVSVHSSWAV